MRRFLATVALSIVAPAIVGCSADKDPTAAPSVGADEQQGQTGSAPRTESAQPARASGNGAQVCAEALKSSSASAQVYVAELGKMLQATGVQDTAAAREAEQRAVAAVTDWSTALREQSAKATDPRLKALLAEIATEVGTMKPDIASIQESRLEQLQQRLDELCGG